MKNAAPFLAGVRIGAWGIPSLKAQTGGQGADVVAKTHVIDPAGSRQLLQREPATPARYRGHIAARRA